MNELVIFVLYIIGAINGFTIAYIRWAPETEFKRQFIDGITLKFIWKQKW